MSVWPVVVGVGQNVGVADRIDSLFAEADRSAPPTLTIPELRIHLQRQANLIVETGTGGRPFRDVEPEYQETDAVLVANFRRLGLEPPFPWRSIWEWYGFYSSNLETYRERREHVRQLTQVALERLHEVASTGVVHDPSPHDDSPTWEAINARIAGLINEYSAAQDKDSWQDVGRRSREILIDLGKLIADPSIVSAGHETPKGADARAWFDLVVEHHAAGSDRAELRALMRKTWDLAQKVTHGDIDDVDAFAAAQATVLLVRTTQKLIGN